MLLEFRDIPEDGLELDRLLRLHEGGLLPGPVRLAGRLRHGRRGVEFRGEVRGTVRLECSRCLEPVDLPLHGEFFLIVVSRAVEFGAGEQRLAVDDCALFYADRGRVDLREIAREQIHLNLPLKPVCRPDCAGLCPTCGANRNRIECPCRLVVVDPRLAPLEALNRQGEGEEPD